jgi:hypothetical protein
MLQNFYSKAMLASVLLLTVFAGAGEEGARVAINNIPVMNPSSKLVEGEKHGWVVRYAAR